IKEETIIRVEQVFDSLLKSKQMLNDLYQCARSISDNICNKIINVNEKATNLIHELKECLIKISSGTEKFNEKAINFSQELRECLIKIRSGTEKVNILESKIEQLENSILSKDSVMGFINKHRSIFIKTELISVLTTNK
ncbi:7917_t:CDS:1, partial [Ambispora gerdemannii]